MKIDAPALVKWISAKIVATFFCLLASTAIAQAESYFSEPVYVTLRESDQIARFPGKVIWDGGPKMLYTSVTPNGKIVVASSPKEGSVYIFDAHNGKQLSNITTDKAAKGLKVSPDGEQVYVCNEGANTVSIVNLAQKKVVKTISVGNMPHNIRFSDDGKKAYVTLQGAAGLAVIDTEKQVMTHVIATEGLATPHNIDLSKDGKMAFIRDTSNQVGVLDLTTGKMKKIIPVGQGHAGIDVTPDGKWVFTGAIADDVVTVINAKTLSVVKSIKVGFGPHGVRASADNRYLYVAVTADDSFVVIDIKSMEVVKTYPLTSFPFWVAVNGNP